MSSGELIVGVLFIALSAGLLSFSLWIVGSMIVRRIRQAAGQTTTAAAFEYDWESESAA